MLLRRTGDDDGGDDMEVLHVHLTGTMTKSHPTPAALIWSGTIRCGHSAIKEDGCRLHQPHALEL